MVTTICRSTLSFQGNPPFLANNKWRGGSNYGTDISRLQKVVVKPENYKIYFFVRGGVGAGVGGEREGRDWTMEGGRLPNWTCVNKGEGGGPNFDHFVIPS